MEKRRWLVSLRAFVLLTIFAFPLVSKGLHHHDLHFRDIDHSLVSLNLPGEACEIFDFEYLSFDLVDVSPYFILSSLEFSRGGYSTFIPYVALKVYFLLRAPPFC